ncbi:hypothetical protein CMQ_7369 [Grosmannia clavigera kw1407]|uniref:Uncharacterized protein n=1 Tax=Grosmannia clavigera (strain kw1407 / UAMH 11150) TaxID=655863 RepID=F0XPU1_GROCL|nr:uncharacterized protein CMQ_7369 [Grosmannia clavigera kw1407]EFX00367.1 hypothetical protein CMQ_7369 [Grosmannia clavigera kw1407]
MEDQAAFTFATNVICIIGLIVAYFGAETAAQFPLENLLYPQRFFAAYRPRRALVVGLLLPMGGPLSKVALDALDGMFTQGLFVGPLVGHMLDTIFFCRSNWTYTLHGHGHGYAPHSESVRNCIWVRALCRISVSVLGAGRDRVTTVKTEKDTAITRQNSPTRSQTFVTHLTLAHPSPGHRSFQDTPLVSEDAGSPSRHVFLAIVTAEATAILTAAGIWSLYRSVWAALWLIPLLLRLVSAFFALDREPALDLSLSLGETPRNFEIHCPESLGGFLLITGPPSLVLQFFRHYGHPIRNRCREVVQFLTVAALGCFFPISIFCFVAWMPAHIQYVWLCYQTYIVAAMCVGRYSLARFSTTTESRIGELLAPRPDTAQEQTILFGQARDGLGTVRASAETTYFRRYEEGRNFMQQLLHQSEAK